MTELVVLKETRKLLSDKSRWSKGAYCRRIGDNVSMLFTVLDNTRSYCLLGAVTAIVNGQEAMKYAQDEGAADLVEKCRKILKTVVPKPKASVESNNDDPKTKHEDVLSWLDKAIANVESGGTGGAVEASAVGEGTGAGEVKDDGGSVPDTTGEGGNGTPSTEAGEGQAVPKS